VRGDTAVPVTTRRQRDAAAEGRVRAQPQAPQGPSPPIRIGGAEPCRFRQQQSIARNARNGCEAVRGTVTSRKDGTDPFAFRAAQRR